MRRAIKRVMYGCISKINRKKVVRKFRQRNDVKQCSIISSNCIGGILAHDLGLRFDSPTINLWFDAQSFIKYVENIEYYARCNPGYWSLDQDKGYPIGKLDEGIEIHFQHYRTVNEAEEKWRLRSQRIDFDNLYVICTDRDGMTLELLKRFLKLPYKKIIYVGHKEMILTKECIYIPGFENEKQLPDLTGWADYGGYRYYEKYFDIIGWLNDFR